MFPAIPDMPGVPGAVAVDRGSPLWKQTVREVVEMFAKRRKEAEEAAAQAEKRKA